MAFDFGPQCKSLPGSAIEGLREIPTTIIGDELGRKSILDPAIRPIVVPARFAGPALTVECAAGDISAVLYGLERLRPGQVVVIDARGYVGATIWGEIMQTTARRLRAAAVVIDGAIRDMGFIRTSGLATYARAVTPRGPQAAVAGSVDRTVSCGGVPVAPGDLVVGDEDGVVIVRPDELDGLVERCRARVAFEVEIIKGVLEDGCVRALLGLPAVDP